MERPYDFRVLIEDAPAIESPSVAVWLKHIALLVITFCTATIAGSIYPFGRLPLLLPEPQSWGDALTLLLMLPALYFMFLGDTIVALLNDTSLLIDGISFSLSLLFILVSHEMGHYIACRIYRVRATLPFFIPTPPMIGPAGTFGAFIKILEPMPSQKAVFDIGVAGPIAGFLALIPIAVIGVLRMTPADPAALALPDTPVFSDPLLLQMLGAAVGKDPALSVGNPFYFAAWVGLLVTALNLIPSGQLDGGHAIYAVFGKRVHFFTGRIAFVIMTGLSIVGFVYFNSPSGFLIAVLLGIMARIRHPEPWDQTPLDGKRNLIAFLTLVIFVLSFVPFPIKVN